MNKSVAGGKQQRVSSSSESDLVVVKDGVCEGILPWDCDGPQLLHEEHLVGEGGDDPWTVRGEREKY